MPRSPVVLHRCASRVTTHPAYVRPARAWIGRAGFLGPRKVHIISAHRHAQCPVRVVISTTRLARGLPGWRRRGFRGFGRREVREGSRKWGREDWMGMEADSVGFTPRGWCACPRALAGREPGSCWDRRERR
eukprot:5629773-Pleurochrysis_carterae.AAC.2